ncbi:hypothetical protein P171DRAFT_480982 [Karstenula rhodostoma CBS 690.94]|uniref:DUF6604 domain-containing protein n=1 Tax=Karstenula rhodostoma CBS 690.94 TaxID=1392251 RepID=A0A9P4PTJ3_9PLEO|nr:hypothetical protein P171DRAFT_480982 [Karstenula rhodostoma CBS 690.94]
MNIPQENVLNTEYIAGWLAHTAKQCGHEVRTPQPKQQQSQKKKGKAKSTPSTKYASSQDSIICVKDFQRMAEAIASSKPRIHVPRALESVFNRAIRARRKVWLWWEANHSGTDSNKRHSHFISVLETAIGILKPLISSESHINTKGVEHVTLNNRFAGLTVEENDPYDGLIVEVKQAQLPNVPSVVIKQDEEELEEEFFFTIELFLNEVEEVRLFIFGEWINYKKSCEGLTRAAILTNTAVDLVRSAEHQFEQMLVRPKKYPAEEFPVWTLPALLFYHGHKVFHEVSPKLFMNPSLSCIPKRYHHNCAQQRYYMSEVYNALKLYRYLLTKKMTNVWTCVTPETLGKPELTWMTYLALEWAQIAYAAIAMGPHFGTDEMMRGIKHMIDKEEVNIWVIFAMQLHIDISTALGYGRDVSMPFNEYKAFVEDTVKMWDGLDKSGRPFPDLNKKRASSSVADLTEDLTQWTSKAIETHSLFALEDVWASHMGSMKDHHEIIGKTLHKRLGMSPWRCGLLKYQLELQLQHSATSIEYKTKDLIMLDMEFMLQRQGPDHLFHGGFPKNLAEACNKLDLACGKSALNHANNRRRGKIVMKKSNLRRFKDPSVLADPVLQRVNTDPESNADAHKWVSVLVSLMCNPEMQRILDRHENLPIGTYETSAFLKSLELQRKPKPLLTEFRYWLLADAIDQQFD